MAITNSGMTLYEDNNAAAGWSGSDGFDSEVSIDGGGSSSSGLTAEQHDKLMAINVGFDTTQSNKITKFFSI